MCWGDETKQNENGADVGEPCDKNDDCTSGWCNIHSIPHVCGAVDEKDGGVVKHLLLEFLQ